MKKTYTKKQIQEAIEYWENELKKLNESENVLKVLCVYSAEFEQDIPYCRGVASREGDDFVDEQVESDTEKSEKIKFPVYLNVNVPSEIGVRDFESVRDEIEEYAVDAFNDTNDFKFVKAISLEFDDATDDMLVETDGDLETIFGKLNEVVETEGALTARQILDMVDDTIIRNPELEDLLNVNAHVGTFEPNTHVGDIQEISVQDGKINLILKKTTSVVGHEHRGSQEGCFIAGGVMAELQKNLNLPVFAVKPADSIGRSLGKIDNIYAIKSVDFGPESGIWLRMIEH